VPVSRDLAVDLSQTLVDMYTALETRLAKNIADALARGASSPDWATEKLDAVAALNRRQRTVLGQLNGPMADQVAQALVTAYYRGGVAATEEVARWQPSLLERLATGNAAMPRLAALAGQRAEAIWRETARLREALPGIDAIQRLAWTLTSQLSATHTPLLRWADDVYRKVIAESTVAALAGTQTRQRAAQVAWERLLAGGVRGFTDQSGRNWELASYVEMATRTTSAQAAVEGQLDRLAAAGIDLVIVSNAAQECKLCRPYEAKILTRGDGPVGRVEVPHAAEDRMITVNVFDTVSGAVRAGLMHPNCRHSLSGYFPGATTVPTNTEDPQGDADRQRLRDLERRLRRAKLRADAVIDPAARPAANKRVRDLQGQIRQHVKDTGLVRQPNREQIHDRGLDRPDGLKPGAKRPKPTPNPRPGTTRKRLPADDRPTTTKAAPPSPTAAPKASPKPKPPPSKPAPAKKAAKKTTKKRASTAGTGPRLTAADVTPEQGRQIAASAMRAARGEITQAEHRKFVRELTNTDSRGRRRPTPAAKADELADLDKRSDDDLFAMSSRYADDPAKLKRVLAELDRRDRASVDPLAGVKLEGIGARWLDHYAREHADRPDVLDRLNAERARRVRTAAGSEAAADAPALKGTRARAWTPEDEADTPEQRRVTELVASGRPWMEAYAEAFNLDFDDLTRQARNAAVDANRSRGETREDTIRRMYREYTSVAWMAAEAATRGHMLNKAGKAAGIDPVSLFSGPVTRARKYGSEDLLRWFADNGRQTYTEFRAQLLGRDADRRAAETTKRQSNGKDFV
jgi:hypothetical protein